MAFDLATAKPVEATGFDLSTARPIGEPAPAKPKPTSTTLGMSDDLGIGRQLGLTARAAIQGGTAIPNMVGDALGLHSSEAVRSALTKFGLPDAENPEERFAQDVASGLTGAGAVRTLGTGLAKAGNALTQRIGEMLASRPGLQVASGATGAGAGSVVREEGGSPLAQMAASIVGSLAPSGPALAEMAVRGLARGGPKNVPRMQQNIDTFEQSGAGTPTVGQASESRLARTVESLLAKLPGSSGRIQAKAEAEAAGMGGKVEQMAGTLSPRTGAAPAGRAINTGIKEFVDDFRGQSGKLYDELDVHMPKGTNVKVDNTRAALEALNADIPGAPALSKWFKNAKIQGIEGALKKDAPATEAQEIVSTILGADGKGIVTGTTPAKAGGVPYEALKKLRTLVGNEISDSTIASDVPRSKWKALYAALSKDMGVAAKEAGPDAEASFVRANNYHRAGLKRMEDVLDPVIAKGDPEDIFKAAVSGTKEGATTLQGVMKSLPRESRQVVAATMLRRMGKANAGAQDDVGEVFSSETFLTNWNKLHPDAKRQLFSTLPEGMQKDLDKVASVAANIREGSKVFANPSGTSPALNLRDTAGGAVIAMLTGNPGIAAAIGAGVGGAKVSSWAMTNPTFVRWLAQITKDPVEQLPAQLNHLFQQSLYLPRAERRELRDLIKEVREGTRQEGQTQATEAGGQPK